MRTIDVLEEIAARNASLLQGSSLALSSWIDIRGSHDNPRRYHSLPFSQETIKSDLHRLWNEAREEGWDLGFCSRVTLKSEEVLHIPQIDFRAQAGAGGEGQCLEKLVSVIGAAKSGKTLPGYLLCSGQSYHYIGLQLLSEEEWRELIGLCLLCEDGGSPDRFSPIDRRWVGHSIIRGHSILRIFEKENRPVPQVVRYVASARKPLS